MQRVIKTPTAERDPLKQRHSLYAEPGAQRQLQVKSDAAPQPGSTIIYGSRFRYPIYSDAHGTLLRATINKAFFPRDRFF
jgi:hypothetical protein